MTFTSHGHHIDGTFYDYKNKPEQVARCGGPGLCIVCSSWAARAVKQTCGDHRPVQHRDARPPWCNHCGLTADHKIPVGRLDKPHQESSLDPDIPTEVPAQTPDESYQDKARRLVVDYVNTAIHRSDPYELTIDRTYVVWFSKVLQNWKCLISTQIPDLMYYEVTYNGDKQVTYVDAYRKWQNVEYPDVETVDA